MPRSAFKEALCGSQRNGLSTQVPYDVPSRCSVAEHKLRVTAFCALRNILRHTGSMMEHRDGTHRSLHDICSVFTSHCTGFGMPRPVLYVFSNTGSSFHVFISGVVMLPRKSRPFFRHFDWDRSSFSVRVRKKARLVSLLIILILSSEESEYHPPKRRQWWVNPMNTVRDERGEYLDVVVELRKYPKRFHRYFHMSVQQFDILLDCLTNSIRKKTTNWRKPIPPEIRLAVTLR